MCSPGINEERELRGQPANPGSPGKMAVKTVCVCVCVYCFLKQCTQQQSLINVARLCYFSDVVNRIAIVYWMRLHYANTLVGLGSM